MRAKVLVAFLLVLGVGAYLILMDLGINAGRIHHGVSVGGITIGGMTFDEAKAELQETGSEIRFRPVVLSAEGMDCSFIPDELGWGPKPKRTAETARDVGFSGGLLSALRDRITAYFSGVEVEWADKPNPVKVTELIDECEEQADGVGVELNRYKLRRRIARAIVTWPRRVFQIPVRPG